MSNRFDVVYVTHDSISEGIGMSQIVPVVIGLSKLGNKIGLISCEKSTPSKELRELMSKNGVYWHPLSFGLPGPIGGLQRLMKLCIFLPKASRYHCRGDISATAVHLRRKPYLWDVRGLWLDQKIILENLKSRNIVVIIARFLESFAASGALAITTLTHNVYPVLRKRHPKITIKHKVIRTCTDLKLFQFVKNMPNKNRLLLSGVFNQYYDLDKIKEFIEAFRRIENLEVVWAHGREAKAKRLNVGEDEIKILARHHMPSEIASSTFGLALCKVDAGESLKGVMPTKIAEFLATGRPIVVSKGVGDLDEIIEKNRIGIVLSDDLDKNVKSLLELLQDPELPLRCRRVAVDEFNIDNAIVDYAQLLDSIGISKSKSFN